ncbi:MAG: long-chain-acyl-CoA synthetase [Pseudomonadota bacterium]
MVTEPAQINRLSFAYRFAKMLLTPRAFAGMRQSQKTRAGDTLSLCYYLERNAAERPDGIALRCGDRQWTWADFNTISNQYAHYFKSQGIETGDCVAIDLQNRAEVLFLVMGITKLGAIAAMINNQQSGNILAHSLNLVQPKLLVFGEECIEQAHSIGDLLKQDYAGQLLMMPDDGLSPAPKGFTDVRAAAEPMPTHNIPETKDITLGTAAYYIYTSGTTGFPKASIFTHLRAVRGGTYMGQMGLTLGPDDVFYCPLPFYHSNALVLAFTGTLVGGGTLAIDRKFSVTRFWDQCRRYRATVFCYIGETLRYLLNQPEKANDRDHKVIKIIGNGLRPDIWMDFKNRFGIERICEFYGATEGNAAFFNLFNFDQTCGWAPGAGKIWNIVAYDIDADEPMRDNDGRLKALGEGDIGLLIAEVTDANPYNGYSDKDATEKKLFRHAFTDGDAWFNTGDLVKRLACGHIQFVDRVGDTFRWQGENVATTQVEAAVISFPEVDDAVVYGVSVPGMDGRCGMLALTPTDGSSPDLDGLAHHLREALPAYAVPRFLRLQCAMEMTGTFKHKKSTLKDEGFDPHRVDGEVFFLPPSSGGWLPVTEKVKLDIESGAIRL